MDDFDLKRLEKQLLPALLVSFLVLAVGAYLLSGSIGAGFLVFGGLLLVTTVVTIFIFMDKRGTQKRR